MEKIIVLVLIFSSILMLLIKLVRMFQGKGTGCSCGECGNELCEKKKG